MNIKIFGLLNQLFATLSPDELDRIYWRGARLWIDTEDYELRFTYGPPTDQGAHQEMAYVPSFSQWVWTGIECDESPDHPINEEGYPDAFWDGTACWVREQLLLAAEDITYELETKIEQAADNLVQQEHCH